MEGGGSFPPCHGSNLPCPFACLCAGAFCDLVAGARKGWTPGRTAMQRTKRISLLLGAALFFSVSAVVRNIAQTYPTRPVRIVVPFGAGGGTDNLARIAEPYVSRALGQSIIIDNRPGGGSVIGTDTVAKSAPDGYTVLMTDSSVAVNPSLLKNLPFPHHPP
jgi:tripartite-type tricarboxylate transporter receptor subunit TctC